MSVLSIRDVESTLDARVVEGELRQKSIVTQQQLAVAITKRNALSENGEPVGLCEILVRDRFLPRHLAEAFLAGLTKADIDSAESILNEDICQRYGVRPLQVVGGVLHLEAVGVLRRAQIDAIIAATTVRVSSVKVVPVSRLTHHRTAQRLSVAHLPLIEALGKLKREDINSDSLRAAIEALFNEAMIQRASDIHIDCQPDPDAWISFRVDGKLRQFAQVPERVMSALFTRLKTIAGMDASDRLRPQDGRISFEYSARKIDLRMASQPVIGGETITLRVLDPDSLPPSEKVFAGQADMIDFFNSLARFQGKNGGLILISGPTGSGKTATLYSLLQKFERDRYNIITVEDPVEFTIPFARQIQINQILRQRAVDIESSILRHDPDIVMFGELRNADMARAALALAESGHLVLATIHAGTAMQTYERLVRFFPAEEMADASYILGQFLRTIINMRLVPKLCKCAEPIELGSRIRRAVGCEACNFTGYFGRVAAHDSILLPRDEARRAPISRAMSEAGVRLEVALNYAGARHITRAEVLGVLRDDGVIDELTVSRGLEN